MTNTPEATEVAHPLSGSLQSWAREGFPNRWPLMNFCEEPTRFVPLRITDPSADSPPGSIGLLINGFPERARGARFFQLRVSLQPPHDQEFPSSWAQWQVIDGNQEPIRTLVNSYVEPKALASVTDVADWLLPLLRGACEMTNRPVIPTRRTLRLSP